MASIVEWLIRATSAALWVRLRHFFIYFTPRGLVEIWIQVAKSFGFFLFLNRNAYTKSSDAYQTYAQRGRKIVRTGTDLPKNLARNSSGRSANLLPYFRGSYKRDDDNEKAEDAVPEV